MTTKTNEQTNCSRIVATYAFGPLNFGSLTGSLLLVSHVIGLANVPIWAIILCLASYHLMFFAHLAIFTLMRKTGIVK